jgi:glutamate formiminotransferase
MASRSGAVFMGTAYITVGRRPEQVTQLSRVAEAACTTHPHLSVLTSFSDAHYNRSSWVFGGASDSVIAGLRAVVSSALATLELPAAVGFDHPRVGLVDHVNVAPLHSTSLQQAGAAAAELGAALAREHGLPVYTYGAAHPQGRGLSQLRRATTFFSAYGSGSRAAVRASAAGIDGEPSAASAAPPLPEYGPAATDAGRGCVMIGASLPVLNFNVRISGLDAPAARALARGVSARTGGLPTVEAMALKYERQREWEVACNLLDVGVTPPSAVLARVQAFMVDAPALGPKSETHALQDGWSSGAPGHGGPKADELPVRRGATGPNPGATISSAYTIGITTRQALQQLRLQWPSLFD